MTSTIGFVFKCLTPIKAIKAFLAFFNECEAVNGTDLSPVPVLKAFRSDDSNVTVATLGSLIATQLTCIE